MSGRTVLSLNDIDVMVLRHALLEDRDKLMLRRMPRSAAVVEQLLMRLDAAIARRNEENMNRGRAAAAQQAHNLRVEGSSPSPGTIHPEERRAASPAVCSTVLDDHGQINSRPGGGSTEEGQ